MFFCKKSKAVVKQAILLIFTNNIQCRLVSILSGSAASGATYARRGWCLHQPSN